MGESIDHIFILLIGITLTLAGLMALIYFTADLIRKKTSKVCKAAVFFVGIALTIGGGKMSYSFFDKPAAPSIEEQFLNAINIKNSDLPRMLDQDTRLDKVSLSGKQILLQITLTNYSVEQLNKEKVHNLLETNWVHAQCSVSGLVGYYNQGISSNYTVLGKNGKLITNVIITKDSCLNQPSNPRINADGK